MSKPEAILSDFLTKEELASELGPKMRTLDRWDALGIGPPRTRVGRKVLYRRASVQRWLAAQEHCTRGTSGDQHSGGRARV
jgi:phage terminase Nu1 subunit (DNA packaging protein)